MKPYTPYSVYGNGWLIISVATPSCSSSTCRVEVSRLSLANTYWLAYGSGIEINRLSTTMPFSRSSSFHRSTKRMQPFFESKFIVLGALGVEPGAFDIDVSQGGEMVFRPQLLGECPVMPFNVRIRVRLVRGREQRNRSGV